MKRSELIEKRLKNRKVLHNICMGWVEFKEMSIDWENPEGYDYLF
jgi:hypothetical protein